MKRCIKEVTLGIAIVAACTVTGCAGAPDNNKAMLSSENDSISYAASMLLAEELPHKIAAEGIDSTTIDDFVRGVRTAFPLDDTAESRAFLSGIYVAVEAAEMLERVNESVYPDEKEKKIDRRLFLEGVIASATGNNSTMNSATAEAYYNQKIFRSRSEQFITNNKKRPGVVTLPSGVQYKVETMGKGKKADYSSKVTCVYKGMYPNGAVFSSSRGESVELSVSELVPGLAQVLMTLPAGTRCMAYIPWHLAYGPEGNDNIAPYSALVYDLEIIEVK